MKYRIDIPDHMQLDELKKVINQGGRFIVFPYCISLIFAITLKRLSPAILITSDEEYRDRAKPYRAISLVFGWWCIPWGPMRTLQFLKQIKNGALDVTSDIMLNLDEAGLAAREVVLRQMHQVFIKPETSSVKSMQKMLRPVWEQDPAIQKIVAGMFVNTDKPFYVIGIRSGSLAAFYGDQFTAALRKDFYKTVKFEYIDLDTEPGLLLQEQGFTLFDREATAPIDTWQE